MAFSKSDAFQVAVIKTEQLTKNWEAKIYTSLQFCPTTIYGNTYFKDNNLIGIGKDTNKYYNKLKI